MGFGRYSGEAEKAQFYHWITICMAVQAGVDYWLTPQDPNASRGRCSL
jgi:hypothetical protein